MMAARVAGRRRPARYAPDADTWDHVVRAAARCGQLEAAALLMRLTREHAHDPELLARTRCVRGGGEGFTLLMRAVERRDVARAAEIVGACPTPAARAELLACTDGGGWTALHRACFLDHEDEDEDAALALVELLLGAGADPLARARDRNAASRFQPIHFAADWSARLVQRLVAAGASIDGDVAGDSTLCQAARGGRCMRMIPALVALGARRAMGSEVFIVCSRATGSQQEVHAALAALVSVGCSLTAPDTDGWTPMDGAARGGNAPVVAALLAMGVAATGQSLAHGAGHPDIVRVLLAAGAPPDEMVGMEGDWVESATPLMRAARTSSLESVRLLLGAGAAVNDFNEHGCTALMYALQGVATIIDGARRAARTTEVVETLLAAGASPNARDFDGETPLHYLARNGAQWWAAGVARLLLARGANASATNYIGKTPAACAHMLLDRLDDYYVGRMPVHDDDSDEDGEDAEGAGARVRAGELHALLLHAAAGAGAADAVGVSMPKASLQLKR